MVDVDVEDKVEGRGCSGVLSDSVECNAMLCDAMQCCGMKQCVP